ncbi:hypothetical protein BH20ACT3_BH20ACT3_08030 [soil metagenome]
MSDPTDDQVAEATRATESDDEHLGASPDRPPTAEEEAAADRAPEMDPEVAENYKREAERGANVEGEGKIG